MPYEPVGYFYTLAHTGLSNKFPKTPSCASYIVTLLVSLTSYLAKYWHACNLAFPVVWSISTTGCSIILIRIVRVFLPSTDKPLSLATFSNLIMP